MLSLVGEVHSVPDSHLSKLPSLTALRAFAAFSVLVWHMQSLHLGGVFHPAFNATPNGVAVFFVLSGFVLAWSARPGNDAIDFWRRRAARILPASLTVTVFMIVTALVLGRQDQALLTLPGLLLVQSWIPDSDVYFAGNVVAWSLSCEVFFYMMFPFLLSRLSRLTPARLMRVCVIAVAAEALLEIGVYLVAGGDTVNTYSSHAAWIIYVFPVSRLPEFVVGVCAALALRAGARTRLKTWHASALTLVAGYLSGLFSSCAAGTWILVLPVALLIITLAQRDLTRDPGILGWRWLQYAGRVSFCFYLVQLVPVGILRNVLPDNAATNLLGLIVAVIAAVGLHHCVEVPAERKLRPKRDGRRVEATEATEATESVSGPAPVVVTLPSDTVTRA